MAEVQPRQHLANAAFVHRYLEPSGEATRQIFQSPPHDLVFPWRRARAYPVGQFRLLGVGQFARWTTRMGPVVKTRQAVGVVADNPITQRLTIHAAGLGGSFSRGPFYNQRQGQNTACVGPLLAACRLGAQFGWRVVVSDDWHRHFRLHLRERNSINHTRPRRAPSRPSQHCEIVRVSARGCWY